MAEGRQLDRIDRRVQQALGQQPGHHRQHPRGVAVARGDAADDDEDGDDEGLEAAADGDAADSADRADAELASTGDPDGSGGGGRLRIEAMPHDADRIEFMVEDNGLGIDPEVSDRLFESFVTTKGGGMGVGLSFCKQIVENYGCSIWATRSPSLGGAAFHFTLPAGRESDVEEKE